MAMEIWAAGMEVWREMKACAGGVSLGDYGVMGGWLGLKDQKGERDECTIAPAEPAPIPKRISNPTQCPVDEDGSSVE